MIHILIKIIAICILLCSASCSTKKTLVPYGRKNTIHNIYGAYIILSEDTITTVKGELLAIDSTYTYILTEHGSHIILNENIQKFNIVLTDNYSRTESNLMGISVIPSTLGMIIYPEYSDGFAFLAVGIAISGGAGSVIEGLRKGHIISYPEFSKNFHAYCKYARFPGGIPKDTDIKNFDPWWDKISRGKYK